MLTIYLIFTNIVVDYFINTVKFMSNNIGTDFSDNRIAINALNDAVENNQSLYIKSSSKDPFIVSAGFFKGIYLQLFKGYRKAGHNIIVEIFTGSSVVKGYITKDFIKRIQDVEKVTKEFLVDPSKIDMLTRIGLNLGKYMLRIPKEFRKFREFDGSTLEERICNTMNKLFTASTMLKLDVRQDIRKEKQRDEHLAWCEKEVEKRRKEFLSFNLPEDASPRSSVSSRSESRRSSQYSSSSSSSPSSSGSEMSVDEVENQLEQAAQHRETEAFLNKKRALGQHGNHKREPDATYHKETRGKTFHGPQLLEPPQAQNTETFNRDEHGIGLKIDEVWLSKAPVSQVEPKNFAPPWPVTQPETAQPSERHKKFLADKYKQILGM